MKRWRICSDSRSMATTISRMQDADRADLLIDVEADHAFQFLADAAGADEADDGGGADVDLEPQQRVAEEAGQDLRHDAEADLREPGAADGADAVHRPQVGIFVQLAEQLSQRAGGVDGDGEDAGQRADAERPDQDEGEHDLRDGAHELQQAAGDEDDGAAADEGAGRRETTARRRRQNPARWPGWPSRWSARAAPHRCRSGRTSRRWIAAASRRRTDAATPARRPVRCCLLVRSRTVFRNTRRCGGCRRRSSPGKNRSRRRR